MYDFEVDSCVDFLWNFSDYFFFFLSQVVYLSLANNVHKTAIQTISPSTTSPACGRQRSATACLQAK